jgi:hypothetical protein
MARYTGPRLKIIRSIVNYVVYVKNSVVFLEVRPIQGKVIPPGQHGLKLFKTRPYDSAESDYLIRLK